MERVKVWDSKLQVTRDLSKKITETKWFKNSDHLSVIDQKPEVKQVKGDLPIKEEEPESQEEAPSNEKQEGGFESYTRKELIQHLKDTGIYESSDFNKNKKNLLAKVYGTEGTD